MKKSIDNFSHESASYKKFRPVYPPELYQEILPHVKEKNICWDCGTGNGQVAVVLSGYFKQVYATDISENQLSQAEKKPNITYQVERAEQTHFPDQQFDLITVGQAIHWFDVEAFRKEVKRVMKPGGILSVWGYSLIRVDEQINPLIDDYNTNIMGKYWDKERKHVDYHYSSIELGFDPVPVRQDLRIQVQWSLSELEGYLNTWSSLKHYKKEHSSNPVDSLMERIKKVWKTNEKRNVHFPLFLKLVKVE